MAHCKLVIVKMAFSKIPSMHNSLKGKKTKVMKYVQGQDPGLRWFIESDFESIHQINA